MVLWLAAICGFLLINVPVDGLALNSPLEIAKQWDLINYNFDWDAPVNDKSFYNGGNIVATGIAVGYDRIFVATPRLFSGVAATVSSVSRAQYGDSPPLQAFPDWTYHTVARGGYNCSDLGLVSVYRLRIDSCNRLWALDAGVSRSLEDYEITCPPKILVFDLNTNQVVRRIDFPREVRRGESLYTNLIIDETTSRPENNCDDAFVYISDTVEPAIIVYDSARDLTWRLTHPSMYPDPDFGQSRIGNDRFTLMDGIVGLAFNEKSGIVYFQPLATDRLFSITTSVLRAGPPPVNQELPVRLVGKKSSQGIGLAVSPLDGSIFFSPVTETAIAQWNPSTNQQRILSYDQERLQFVADLQLSRFDPGALYALSSKFHRFFLKSLNPTEINTRIIRLEAFGFNPQRPQYVLGYQPGLTGSFKTSVQPLPTSSAGPTVFSSVRKPYEYENASILSRGARNPFTAVNAGEQPLKITVAPTVSSSFFRKFTSDYGDFNGLRFAKSISYNTTVAH